MKFTRTDQSSQSHCLEISTQDLLGIIRDNLCIDVPADAEVMASVLKGNVTGLSVHWKNDDKQTVPLTVAGHEEESKVQA